MFLQKKVIFKRFLSVLLCVVLTISCLVVPASAVWLETLLGAWSVVSTIAEVAATFGTTPDRMMKVIWNEINNNSGHMWTGSAGLLSADSTRGEVSKEVLGALAYDWNVNYVNAGIDFPCTTVTLFGNDGSEWTVIRLLPYASAGSDLDKNNKQWFLCDGQGRILCSNAKSIAGRWINKSSIKGSYHMLSLDGLYEMAKGEGGFLRSLGGLFVIENNAGTQVLAASDGLPYAAWDRDDSAAVNQDRPTSSGTVTDSFGNASNLTGAGGGSSNIDIDDGLVSFPDGAVQQLGNVIYDQSTKTYYVDSRDYSTTYNQAFSFYQYHINYTSVTYIGQTEEYNKYYEAYYELPDGRDSADLTKEDLEQLSTSLADVVNYARSTDNVDQRVLYHFDGDTQDSSYWSYTTSFDWATGASLTYMDEGVFSGSLYLDETEHDFTVSLPGNDAAGDFTLQFRYYQSYTAAPQTDSYVQIGDEIVLFFNGAMYLDKNGTVICSTSVGSWNEICIVRAENILHYYVNGVFYHAVIDNTYHEPTLRFYFGDKQQTYKKLDELRFTKSVVYTVGEDYTVSSVPFDSSLSLILPDGERPMADEVLVVTPGDNNLFSAKELDDWSTEGVISAVKDAIVLSRSNLQPYKSVGFSLYRNPSLTTMVYDGNCVGVSVGGTSSTVNQTTFGNGFFLPTTTHEYHNNYEQYQSQSTNYLLNQVYTLSVVLSDGTYSSVSFEAYSPNGGYFTRILSEHLGSAVDFNVVQMTFSGSSSTFYSYGIQIVPTSLSVDVLYMELVEGTETQFELGWESAVYPASQLEDSPVLAVRSNIDVTTYQIGGVRPSYPEKGQVFAMVESGYITSLQIYTGTGWESVDGRIWTGSRWIPASSYNVITLQDMFDIVDATPDYEYIYTESGFWDWWQRSWTDFVGKMFGDEAGGSSGSSGVSVDLNDVLPGESDNPDTPEDEGWNVLDLIVVVKDGVWSVVKGVMTTGFGTFESFRNGVVQVGSFFSAFNANSSSNVLGLYNYGGDDIWA